MGRIRTLILGAAGKDFVELVVLRRGVGLTFTLKPGYVGVSTRPAMP